ncbi:hypothetical protein SLEP1_g23934 [Rubroshorea leprosula]|uniref:Uncharacterized protein n=1 Tax=Rubroshorea leprosula TaxID=152421 RepID=A0AAV5JPY8_9ROSI|nr:hypothetical protein SLEP1_g23934 [Rubroshorea leprosula]
MRERGRKRAWDRKSRYQARDGWTALDREAARLKGRSSFTRSSDAGGYAGHSRQQKMLGDWGYDKGTYRQATAFFFTNFPEEWSYTDMWSTFRKFGRVIAIYSPTRGNKSGSRFGFVRFLDVKNEKDLERQLDQIRIEGRKIWVNVAKYPEEKVAMKEISRTAPTVNTIQDRSYADVVGGRVGVKEGKTEDHQMPPQLQDVQRNCRKREGNWQPLRRQTWRVKNRREEWSGFDIEEKFYMEGYFTCRLRAMGGNLVLMDCEDKGELEDLVHGASDWLGQWFSEVKPWSPKEVAKERFAWIRCQRAPLHAWGPDFFERMSSAWGKFICLDDSTSKKRRFDIARFLISTPIMDSISVRRQIKVNGELFSLKFTEEEWTNSLFSLRQDFILKFASDSEIEEHWSEVSDWDEGQQGGKHGGEWEPLVGEDDDREDIRDCSWRHKGLVDISDSEERFESVGKSYVGERYNETDMRSLSRIVEEESVAMVADSINVGEDLSEAGGRDDDGKFESNSKCKEQTTSDPIECPESNGVDLQANLGQKLSVAGASGKEDWACKASSNNQQMGCKVRPVGEGRIEKTCTADGTSDKVDWAQVDIGDNMQTGSETRLAAEGHNEQLHGLERQTEEGNNAEDSKTIRTSRRSEEGTEKEKMDKKWRKEKTRSRKRAKLDKAKPKHAVTEREGIPEFIACTSNSVAGGSLGDSGIVNRNRLLMGQSNRKMAEQLWDFAKKIGATAENEETVIRSLEEMEARDRKVKEAEASKKACKAQKRHLKDLVNRERVIFLAVQETKLSVVDRKICRTIWGSEEFDWAAKNPVGRSGGLLCLWDQKAIRKIRVLEGENFIGVEGMWLPKNTTITIINVYSPCHLTGKRALWEELKNLISGNGGNICLVGDFNTVRRAEERTGCRGVTSEMREFDDFIHETELIDIPLLGRKYTWYHTNGKSMSRIDKFLLSGGWLEKWEEVRQWGLSRVVFDHCPLLLKHKKVDWGPKPFKFFDVWLEQDGCKELIKEVWSNTNIQGWAGFRLKEKLKMTKEALRKWSKNLLPEVDSKINKAATEIDRVDLKGESEHLSEEDIKSRRDATLVLWKNIRIKESMLHQKSRKIWLLKGDANTKFFHNCVKGRWRRSEINSIVIRGMQIEEVSRLKEEIAAFYENLFMEEQEERPKLEGVCFKQVQPEDNRQLIEAFTADEIKAAIWECDSSKAPGPDRFNFRFVKSEWEVIKEDVIEFLQEFHKNSKMVRGLNSSFIVLVPKVDNPQKIEEYRPISLIGVIYKILAKILANRLKKVLDELIGEQQMAFISGRQLMDGVVIANELVDEAKKRKKSTFMFKIDFEKAYDKVSWSFLDYMMLRMGFCTTWRKWIRECLETSTVSILVNGSSTRQFSVSRGLRQGDPLSPFLFLIVAEGLNGLVSTAAQKGLLQGVEVGSRNLKISHLQYADDTILFGSATEDNVWAMKGILRAFELCSGLKINFHKSQLLGICVGEDWLDKMLWILCCKKGEFPYKYLGIPIGGNCRSLGFWKPLVDLFSKKLSTWKASYLSLGGRLTLINSMLSSLPVFWMSMYLIPKGTIRSLDKIRRNFLWGGIKGGNRINWVKWDEVCKDKERGGLGVKDLGKLNFALLGKWWGRIVSEERGLWKKVICEKYGIEGEHSCNWLRGGFNFGSLWWRDTCRLDTIAVEKHGWLANGFKIKVGGGELVKFWWDIWSGGESIANKFPRLYALSTGKDNKISQMGEWVNGAWKWKLQWRRSLYSWEKQQEEDLQRELQRTPVVRGKLDRCVWVHSKDGCYSTRTAYQVLTEAQSLAQHRADLSKVWNVFIPNKIAAFSWQLLQDRAPTKLNLLKRGILQNISECMCDLCGREYEDSNHLFIHCKVAYSLWTACFKWWGLTTALDKDCCRVFEQHPHLLNKPGEKKGWDCIWFTLIWTIWLA